MKKGQPLPPKRDVVQALLSQGSAFLHLDPRVEGVFVPEHLKKQPQLVLQIGLNTPVPIRDLRIDDVGVFGTLSFNRSPFTCMVPWAAIFALVGDDGRGMVWPESVPEEIAQEIQREAVRAGIAVIKEADANADAAAVKGAKPRRARKPEAFDRAPEGASAREAVPQAEAASAPKGLRVIEGAASPSASAQRRSARRAPHLRLVKSE